MCVSILQFPAPRSVKKVKREIYNSTSTHYAQTEIICGLKEIYATILDHYDTCEKKIITCITMEMERMKIKNHLSEECEHTVISCKYLSIGCDVKLRYESP